MARDIGPKIGIDGEAEYRREIQNIIQQAKTLDAEMKAVAASFDKSATAEQKSAAMAEQTAKQIENQKRRVEALTQMVERSAQATGENSTETLSWKEALANAQAELSRLENGLDDTTEKTSVFGETLKAMLSKEAIMTGVKAVADGIKEIGKAALEFGKEVVLAYGDFEQLQGGVQKLFGDDAAAAVMRNAQNAFKTAGLSANEYMETVTSFSASLIKSLGGDTARAADLADQAIRDMSDNANTFGSDMQSIQNAYASFAKGQFNLLDNLNLGYAGSKEGMEQLLADAEALSGVHFDIGSYSDIVQAIHVVQENMNIAGATAKEAEKTISGSIAALKSSFQNFVVGLGTDNADIDQLFGNMVESFEHVVNNVQPVIERLIAYIPQAVQAIIPVISSMLPQLTQTAAELFSSLLTTVVQLLPELVPVAVQAISTIADGLLDNLPLLVQSAIAIVLALADGLLEGLPLLVEQVPVIVVQLIDAIVRSLPQIVATGVQLIGALIQGIISAAGGIAQAWMQVRINTYNAIRDLISGAASWGRDMMQSFANGIAERAAAVWENVKEVARGVWSLLHFSEPEEGPLADFSSWGPDMMKTFAEGIRKNAYRVEDAATAAALGISDGLGAVRGSANAYNYGGFSIVINQQPGQSSQELVDELMFRIQSSVNTKKAVFA